MVGGEKTQHPFPGAADMSAPSLAGALFKLNAALTYEDFATAVEAFLESSIPHASRLVMVGLAQLSPSRFESLVQRGNKTPLPGVPYVPDWEMRMKMGALERETMLKKNGVKAWSVTHNIFAAFGARAREDLRKTEWFRRVMEPERWAGNIFVPFYKDKKWHSGFWLKRAEGQPLFSERDMRLLEHYHPWMDAALNRVRALEEARTRRGRSGACWRTRSLRPW